MYGMLTVTFKAVAAAMWPLAVNGLAVLMLSGMCPL
jgi:hypothetical protein